MMHVLNTYLEQWNLSEPQLLAETPTSSVYTVTSDGARVILKLLTPLGWEEREGAVALRCFDGHGAVRLLHGDDQAHLLEYADGDNLIPLVKNGEDEQATAIIADVLNQLHSSYHDEPPDDLPSLRRWFRELFQQAEANKSAGLSSVYVRAASVAESLLADARDIRVLHGDMHHANIRHHAQRGWLAFDPKGLVGERTFDAANTLCNPIDMPELVQNEGRLLANAGILSEKMGIELPRILAFVFVYASLSASWTLHDGGSDAYALRIAEIAEPYVHA